jgi:hypothetical protein
VWHFGSRHCIERSTETGTRSVTEPGVDGVIFKNIFAEKFGEKGILFKYGPCFEKFGS